MKRVAPALVLVALVAPECTGKRSPDPPAPPSPAASVEGASSGAAPRPVVFDVVRDIDACSFGHRGVLLDFGDPSMRASVHPGSLAQHADDTLERAGATWMRVHAHTLSASFYWPPPMNEVPDAGAYVEGRVRGVAARGVTVSLDGRAVGTWMLAKSEPRVLVARPTTPVTLLPGAHELDLRFFGGSHAGEEVLAEIDWVHVGAGDQGEPYAAPTRGDVVTDATVGGTSMRALSLRAPGFVRCTGWMPSSATLETSMATAGAGDAEVEARLARDHRAPVVLGTAHVAGSTSWTPWSVPMAGLDGEGSLGAIELIVKRAGKGTRVLLAEPKLVAAGASALDAPPTARGVVLVVLGSVSSRSLAPWGGSRAVPELARLVASGTAFTGNRASSSLASAVVASMLTGLSSRTLGINEADARLPRGPTTIAEACRQAGVATAMFTANPTTGAAFGFDRGWDTFSAHDSLEDTPSTRVFDEAAAWLNAHQRDRFFVLVHARGGHPPWDVTPEELKSMPPEGYFGMIEPRRAAEALAKAHKHPGRFKEDDRRRTWALYDHAIETHDAALGRLLAALRTAGHDDDTALIVTSDVAPSEAPPVPFVDTDALDEALLATPLAVRWPNAKALSGRRVDAPSSPIDMARTILGIIGLPPPTAWEGVDLALPARGALVPAERPLAASRADRFSVRWGPFVLSGARERETRMCDLTLDPACVADLRATSPITLEPLHRWAFDDVARTVPAPFPREAAALDAHTVAALVRWGRPTDERDRPDEP